MENVLGTKKTDEMIHPLISDIMSNFIDRERGIILENISDDPNVDCFETRVINAGHGN